MLDKLITLLAVCIVFSALLVARAEYRWRHEPNQMTEQQKIRHKALVKKHGVNQAWAVEVTWQGQFYVDRKGERCRFR
jgi:cell division protein FtsL